MEKVKKEIYKNHKIVIYQDENYDSPDEWGDDDLFLIFDHRDFCIKRKGFDPAEIFENGEKMKGYHVFRCYAYIHSGIALSVGGHSFPDARWDVSFKGFWLVKRVKGWSWRREVARKIAEGFCETWNQYLSGDVYGFRLFSLDENGKKLEEIDSCWGFYGDEGIEQIIEECKSTIDYQLEKKMETV